MKVKKINQREPTDVKIPDKSEASKLQKKKLYRKRTAEEVEKSIHFAMNTYDDGDSDDQDTSRQVVDKTIDTARIAGDTLKSGTKKYSEKLKNERVGAGAKKSDALKSVEKKTEAAQAKSEMLKNESEVTKSAGKTIQKKRIKKEYAKAAKEARNAAASGKTAGGAGKKLVEKGGDVVSATLEQIGKFVAEHPMGCAIATLLFVVVLAVVSCIGSIGVLFGGPNSGSMVSTAFTAKEADLKTVENNYKAKESALQTQINNIPTTYPGYDEYNYSLATIGHDPYELAAYLTTKYDDYEPRDVASALTSLFDSQYSLTTTRVVETRYRWEPRTGYTVEYVYDDEGNVIDTIYTPYTYYVQVAYSYYILNVTLTQTSIDSIVRPGLDYDEELRYDALLATKGGYPDLWP